MKRTTDHGQRFLDLLCGAILSIPKERLTLAQGQRLRAGLPPDFETRLTHFLAEEGNRPFGFQDLVVSSRGADFRFVQGRNIVATCEFKGAARNKVLQDFDCKFTQAIMIDVFKQMIRWPREKFPTAEHHVAVLFQGKRAAVTSQFHETVLNPIRRYLKVKCDNLIAEEFRLDSTYTQIVFRVDVQP
jgi:hypothetical protein